MLLPHWGRPAILVTSALMVALGVVFVVLHLTTPSDGARLDPSQPVWRANGVVITPLRQEISGLRSGDLVVAVNGTSLESSAWDLANLSAPRPSWQRGQVVTYTVVRNGLTQDVPVHLGPYPLEGVWRENWGTILFALIFEFVAVYVVLRRPREPAALVLLLCASGILGGTTWSFGLQVSDLVGGVGFWLYKATSFAVYMLFYIAGLHFALIFPRPHAFVLRHPRWLPVLYVAPYTVYLAYLAAAALGSASILDWLGRWIPGESALAVILLAAMVAAIVWSYCAYRDAETRQKIRWIVFGALVSGIAGLALWNIPGAVLGYPLISTNMLGLLVLPFPVTIAIAILRYRLFDIDTILNRTLVYGTLTAILGAVYLAGVVGTQALTRVITGEDTGQQPAVIVVTTLLVAALFRPLRTRIQTEIDRHFYREKHDTAAIVAAFGDGLRSEINLEDLRARLLAVVDETMHPSASSLWLRETGAADDTRTPRPGTGRNTTR